MLNAAGERVKEPGRRQTFRCPGSVLCPTPIPRGWLLCTEHWNLVPAESKLVNRRVSRKHPRALVCVAAGHALFTLWQMLEVGTPRRCFAGPDGVLSLGWLDAPQDETHRGRYNWDGTRKKEGDPFFGHQELCLCTWCGPMWRAVFEVLTITPSYWLLMLKQAGRVTDLQVPWKDGTQEAEWIRTHELARAALHRRRREAAEARAPSPPQGGNQPSAHPIFSDDVESP